MTRHVIGLVLLALNLFADDAPAPAALNRGGPAFVYAAEGAGGWILRFGTNGVVTWAYPAPMSRDVQVLPNGNVVFPYNEEYGQRPDNPSGVLEVTPDKKIAWQFKTSGQLFSCERLADGRTLIGVAGQGKVLVVDAAGKIEREIVVKNKAGHSCMRHVRSTPQGTVLVAEESAKAVREYNIESGELVREFPVPFAPFSATRLADGHTVVTSSQTIPELDSAGMEVHAIRAADHPELGIRWFAGLRVLPNGNYLVCNAGGKVPFAEFARDGKIVWQSHAEKSDIPVGHGIDLIPAAAPQRITP